MPQTKGIKLDLVDLLRESGWGFMEACELADQAIREFNASGKDRERHYMRNGRSFTIARVQSNIAQ